MEESDLKHILIQNGNAISYNDDFVFINGTKIDDVNKADVKTKVEELKKNFYNNFFKKHFKNLVVLTAAGTSLDNGINCGKTRDSLWQHCLNEIDAFKTDIPDIEKKEFYEKKDIESFLSHIILYTKVNEVKRTEINLLKEKLEAKIKDACDIKLDKSSAPHIDFLNKITSRKSSDSRVQLFTTNYDMLFEEAANQAGFIIIDGFSFTHPRKFSGRYFDYDLVNREKTRVKHEESFVSKVFHLCKLHGSLNWEKNKEDEIIQKDNPVNPLIIYPASDKYESSYEQPYFEMMSRFQQSLRKENTLLIVIGFGFQDKHIQNVIIEAVQQNPSFQLVIVNYNGTGKIETKHLEAFFSEVKSYKVKRNVTIVFDKFKDFTSNFPENQTYTEEKNETI